MLINKKQWLFIGAFALLPGLVQAAAPAGTIMEQKGEVNLENRPAGDKASVYEGNTITTGKDGQAVVRATDGTTIAVRPNSSVKFDRYRFSNNEAQANKDNFLVRLVKGGMRTVSGLIGKRKPENFKVNTTTATIGIRGTDFEVALVDKGRQNVQAGAYSKVIKGGVYIQNQQGKRVDVSPGQVGFLPFDLDKMASEFGLLGQMPTDVFFDGAFDNQLNELHDEAIRDMDRYVKEAIPKGAGDNPLSEPDKLLEGF